MNNVVISVTEVEIPPYQKRVYEELQELQDKYDKLSKFIESPSFSELRFIEQKTLIQQQFVMKSYIDILLKRISLFTSTTI